MKHEAYLIEQPYGGFGRAWQAVCHQCGVLLHINDRAAAEEAVRVHLALDVFELVGPRTPMTADEIADAAHEARMRQKKIEDELAG